jgi:hypothetical protein
MSDEPDIKLPDRRPCMPSRIQISDIVHELTSDMRTPLCRPAEPLPKGKYVRKSLEEQPTTCHNCLLALSKNQVSDDTSTN